MARAPGDGAHRIRVSAQGLEAWLLGALRRDLIGEASELTCAALGLRRAFLLAHRFRVIQRMVPCPHYGSELRLVARAVLERRDLPGDVIELGVFKGGSAAKLSLACAMSNKRLALYDSYEGLPEPEAWDAEHQIERPRVFKRGEYEGTVQEVRRTLERYGDLSVCTLVPGWFEDTLGQLEGPLAVALVDVDLARSTEQAVSAVWPLLVDGGVMFVHDATDAKLRQLLDDDALWSTLGGRPRTSFLPSFEAGFHERASRTLAWFLK